MEAKPKLEEKDVNKFDFTTFELNYIIKNANFNDFQLEVFKRLTDPHGRQTITKISLETNVCERTINRTIKQIKSKILRTL
jgi:hypothetical protein